MTDKDKLKQLLDSWNVGYSEDENTLSLEVPDVKVRGYTGFATNFVFNVDESFREVTIYE